MSSKNVWDINVSDYPRLAGETSDDRRIMRAVKGCTGKTGYLVTENARLIGCTSEPGLLEIAKINHFSKHAKITSASALNNHFSKNTVRITPPASDISAKRMGVIAYPLQLPMTRFGLSGSILMMLSAPTSIFPSLPEAMRS